VGRAGWAAFGVTMVFMVCSATLMLAMPRFLVGLFMDVHMPANAHVVDLAVAFLTVAALFQLVDGAQAVGAGMLRGIHDTTVPMLFAALGYWAIGFATAILFGFHLGWGGVGVWIGLAAGLAMTAVLMMTRWARRERLGLV
jgi:MATE family multidrug resistance protein